MRVNVLPKSVIWSCALACCLLAVSSVAADPPCGQPLCLERLAHMSWPELEALYRQAGPGKICEGYARGRAIYCPDDRLAGVRSCCTRLLWHGKVFCAADSTLINQWCGCKAIRAKVCYGPSWLDGQPSIIMDYCGMSRVWAEVRDEVREVCPGLLLGAMIERTPCGPKFKMWFVLQTTPACE